MPITFQVPVGDYIRVGAVKLRIDHADAAAVTMTIIEPPDAFLADDGVDTATAQHMAAQAEGAP